MIEITCSECGIKKMVKPSLIKQGYGQTCSLACKGKRHSRIYVGENTSGWKGGRIVFATGYIGIYLPGHPRSRGGHVFEHLLVAEKALGRPIPKGVEVHHVDENRSNNTNANLVICNDKVYHKLLHIRKKVFEAGGSPSKDFICRRCKHVKPKTDKKGDYCHPCKNAYSVERYHIRKGETK